MKVLVYFEQQTFYGLLLSLALILKSLRVTNI